MFLDKKEIQERLFNMALLYKKICEENNLRYYIAYGSLLGAVREKDFIPWDDDMDFVMPREDYEKFLKISPAMFDEISCGRFKIRDFSIDGGCYPKLWLRIEDTKVYANTKKSAQTIKHIGGIYIDIFPLDGTFANRWMQKIHAKLISMCNLLWWYMMYRDPSKSQNGINRIILRLLGFIFKNRFGYKICHWIFSLKDYKTAKYARAYCWENRGILPKEIYGDPIAVEIRSATFDGPNQAHIYLEHFYDDYMTPKYDEGHHSNVVLKDSGEQMV